MSEFRRRSDDERCPAKHSLQRRRQWEWEWEWEYIIYYTQPPRALLCPSLFPLPAMPAMHAPSPHIPIPRQSSPHDSPAFYHILSPSSPYIDTAGHRSPTHPLFPYTDGSIPPPPTFSYVPSPPIFAPWPSLLQQNPYPPPSAPMPHKVWILDCRACDTFLTNRGMKAVLLLRPNVSLYSTDALPANCSAYSTNPDALRSPPCRPFAAPRTCECLTQTLCCHTCGSSIGYMIVVPCSRCTSVTANNRATNGHRFVFHSSEVIATVRHYIPNEPGVISVDHHPQPPSSPPPLTPAHPALFGTSLELTTDDRTRSPSLQSPDADLEATITRNSHSLASSRSDSPELSPLSSLPPTSPPSLLATPPSQIPYPGDVRSMPGEPPARKLRAGDVLYWHQLSKTGEIPGVEEDPRARIPNWSHIYRLLDR